ncbi:hypothetical protein ES705_50917 [subsurface metagenome]
MISNIELRIKRKLKNIGKNIIKRIKKKLKNIIKRIAKNDKNMQGNGELRTERNI